MAWTLLDIKNKVKSDLDLEDEQFIDSDEFVSYVNAGIRECEAEIHKLNLEDAYFLTNETLTLVQGTGDYDLPSDIYATKIRSIEFDTADKSYEIKRFRGTKAFNEFMYARRHGNSTWDYKYMLTNSRTDGFKIALAPVAQESGAYVTIWYIRNAVELTLDADECDIPEFINFIIQYVKDQCINKERMTPDAAPSPALSQQRELMVATLTEQVPDGDSGLMEQDLTHYDDSI